MRARPGPSGALTCWCSSGKATARCALATAECGRRSATTVSASDLEETPGEPSAALSLFETVEMGVGQVAELLVVLRPGAVDLADRADVAIGKIGRAVRPVVAADARRSARRRCTGPDFHQVVVGNRYPHFRHVDRVL